MSILSFLSVCFLTFGGQQPAEVSTRDVPVSFKATTNLVMVPVVVRDSKGPAVGDLKQEDFQLFDRGKPQVITRFWTSATAPLRSPCQKPRKPRKSSGQPRPPPCPTACVWWSVTPAGS